ncbi:MAG TPA: hypothetical protein VKK79_20635 [Candidatus Lokiarchaeia archaeon]|nr:hypothetical protein [Candidatus Lokiarchaeia archaeon]
MKLHKTDESSDEGVSITASSAPQSGYTQREKRAGETFFAIIVVVAIFLVFSLAWTIADWIQPNGKFSAFAALSGGLELMIIGVLLFGFFMLFVVFTVLYNRGAMSLTAAIYSAEKMFRQSKATKGARILTGALMISIFVIAGGIVVLVLQSTSLGSSIHVGTSVTGFLADPLTSLGEKFLFFAIIAAVGITLVVFLAWLWNRGTIYFQEKLFLKNK